MTHSIGTEADQLATQNILRVVRDSGMYFLDRSDANWLGHTKKCAKLDSLLLTPAGATERDLAACRKTWREHIRHLELEHGLEIKINNGKRSFAEVPS